MQLPISPNTVTAENRDTFPTTGTPGWLTDGNPATGSPASGDNAYVMNMVLAEMMQPIVDAGLELSGADWTQLSQAIQILITKGITAAALVALSDIACQEGTPGYLRFPLGNGDALLIQWGTYTGVTDYGPTNGIYEATDAIAVTWPVAFSTLFIALCGGVTDVTGYGQQEQTWKFSQSETGGSFSVASHTQNASVSGSYIAIGKA